MVGYGSQLHFRGGVVFQDGIQSGLVANAAFPGSASDDVISGGAENDVITGGLGDDWLDGGAGDDHLYGETGRDMLLGGTGDDTLRLNERGYILASGTFSQFDGGEGTDTLELYSENNGIVVDLAAGIISWIDVSALIEHSITNIENVSAIGPYQGLHTFNGDGHANVLQGHTEMDILSGEGGDDTLRGDAGNDRLEGGDGADRLEGGGAPDDLSGGAGADIFAFSADDLGTWRDLVQDFSLTDGDRIDLSSVLVVPPAVRATIDSFVRIEETGTNSEVFVDRDGGGDSFVSVALLSGVTGLSDMTELANAGTLIL
jgi:Ca2+-binding RTX toxin-like protein